jgi:hypothetical protein
MDSNALDLFLVPLFQGWSLGFLTIAAMWALLTTAIRLWCRILEHDTEIWLEHEPSKISPPPLVFWGERTAKHA